MTKYKKVVQDMLEHNKEVFDEFRILHNKYALEPEKHQEEYNREGMNIQSVMRKYENILCNRSEGTSFNKYSSNLAEKFHEEVRKVFPMIDSIGIKSTSIDPFVTLKRIKL